MTEQRSTRDWSKLHGVSFFLTCFRTPHTLEEVATIVDWNLLFARNPQDVLQKLIDASLLEPLEPAQPLEEELGKLTSDQLRDLARQRGLPVSQPKGALITLLIQRDPEGMQRAALRHTLLRCTEAGQRAVTAYWSEGTQTLPHEPTIHTHALLQIVKWLFVAGSTSVVGNASYDALCALVEGL